VLVEADFEIASSLKLLAMTGARQSLLLLLQSKGDQRRDAKIVSTEPVAPTSLARRGFQPSLKRTLTSTKLDYYKKRKGLNA
jgi:hypothetical protein